MGMAGYCWSAGKKSANSLDHWSYYFIISTEWDRIGTVMEARTLRFPPLAEGIRGRTAR